MRRQHFLWQYLVVAILLTVYGAFFTIRNITQNDIVFLTAVVALSAGVLMLAIYGCLYLIGWVRARKSKSPQNEVEKPEENKEEPQGDEDKPLEEMETPKIEEGFKPSPVVTKRYDAPAINRSIYDSATSRGYVREIGRGPVLEINGNRVRDMRTGNYYRLEEGNVYQEGSGICFQIYGNRISNIHGSQLYEISGSNINKVFGGYFASVSGNRIATHDSSRQFEITGSLSRNMLLLIAALLFGE